MAYADNFRHADDVISHLRTVVPSLPDPLLASKYAGFAAVAAVTVYELAIKDIFCEFARHKHKVLGEFTKNYFDRINGKIGLRELKENYCVRFGAVYVTRFKKRLGAASKQHLQVQRRDVCSSYGNLVVWRNEFAHVGRVPVNATFDEVINAYEDGKIVIHSLAASMVR